MGVAERISLGSVTQGGDDFQWIVVLKQIHSTRVVVLKSPMCLGPLQPDEGDALVTNQQGVLLVVRTADCVPVLLSDPNMHVVGAIHAGWKGAVAGIVPRTLQVCTEEFGSKAEHLQVAIGPAIGPCCYEVDAPVIEPLKAHYPQWPDVLIKTTDSKAQFDLKTFIRYQIEEYGVHDSQIQQFELCTYCHSDRFFSYRRDGIVKGTMLSGIMVPNR